jgi:hypothetical protein
MPRSDQGTAEHHFRRADSLVCAGGFAMLHTKVKKPILVRAKRLSDTRMQKQSRNCRVDCGLIGPKRLDRDAQRRILGSLTTVVVASRRAAASTMGMLATSRWVIVAHHASFDIKKNVSGDHWRVVYNRGAIMDNGNLPLEVWESGTFLCDLL